MIPIRINCRLINLLIILAVLIGLGTWLIPQGIALYHQEEGGKLLAQALERDRDLQSMDENCTGGSLWGMRIAPLINNESRTLVKQAISHLEMASSVNPQLSHTYLLLGSSHLLIDEVQAAVKAYKEFIRLRPENPLGHLELARAYEAFCQAQNAVNEIFISTQKLILGPSCVDESSRGLILSELNAAGVTAGDFIMSGDQSLQQSCHHEALSWYAWGAWMAPNWAEPWIRMGETCKVQEKWDQAINAFQQAIERSEQDRDIWYELGQIYEVVEDWELAIQTYQKGSEGSEGEIGVSDLLYKAGVVMQYFLVPRDLESALKTYNQALYANDFSTDPWFEADTHHQRGSILAGQGNWDEAVEEFEQVLELYPSHYWARLSLASTLWSLDRRERAKELIIEAINLQPERKNAYRILGDFFMWEGETAEAREMYSRVLEIDPEDKETSQLLEALQDGN